MKEEKLKQFWREWELKRLLLYIAGAYVLILLYFWAEIGNVFVREDAWMLFFLFFMTALGVTPVFFAVKHEQVKEKRMRAAREKSSGEYYARERKRDEEELRRFYSDDERGALEGYIRDAFGHIGRMFYDAGGEGFRVDVAVSEPSEERDFYTLTTVGMGAHRMDVPAELAEKNQSFAELTMLLPPEWDLMNDTWPFRVLKETARRPFAEFAHISAGNAYRGVMMEGSGFYGVLVLPATTFGGRPTRLMVPGGRIINFYLLLPIYEDEWVYIVRHQDSYAFWTMYAERVGSVVVDPERESCLSREDEETEWNI